MALLTVWAPLYWFFFEEYDLSNIDPQLQEATLEHLLTMRNRHRVA